MWPPNPIYCVWPCDQGWWGALVSRCAQGHQAKIQDYVSYSGKLIEPFVSDNHRSLSNFALRFASHIFTAFVLIFYVIYQECTDAPNLFRWTCADTTVAMGAAANRLRKRRRRKWALGRHRRERWCCLRREEKPLQRRSIFASSSRQSRPYCSTATTAAGWGTQNSDNSKITNPDNNIVAIAAVFSINLWNQANYMCGQL